MLDKELRKIRRKKIRACIFHFAVCVFIISRIITSIIYNQIESTGYNAFSIYLFCGLILLFGFAFLFRAYNDLKHCNNTLNRLSDIEIDRIQGELNSPTTIYHKMINTYLTKNYIVSYGEVIDIIKYDDVLMAYRFKHKRNLSTLYTCIKVWTRSSKKELMIAKQSDSPLEAEKLHEEVLDAILQKNPQAIVGYNQDLVKKIKDEKRSA